jgi:SAM-dependent methyltransferase
MDSPIRYVTDVPYIAGFTAEISPDWLDLVAEVSGFVPPRRAKGEAFAWCELGCGPGMAPIVFAATHPEGTFHAVDAMPDHIARGRKIAESAGLDNLAFHALDFAAATDLDLPGFQYIVAHGVYAWIDEAAAASLRRFVDRHLAPGGLLYVSYNAMPGWAADMPFQHLVYNLAEGQAGDSVARFAAAAAIVERMLKAGAAALAMSPIASSLEEQKAKKPESYFAHEYLAPAWRPRYVIDVRREMAEIGLAPVGSATLRDNFDNFVLRKAAREALAEIEDPDQRELIRDHFMFQRFRRDVYGRDVARLDDEDRRNRLIETSFALMRPPGLVAFKMATEAGELGFDNPVARQIVARLADGPARLRDCVGAETSEQDVLANALSLCCAGAIWPAGRAAPVDRVNRALLDELDANTETTFRVLPWGTALRFDGTILVALRDGKETPEGVRPWIEFLRKLG